MTIWSEETIIEALHRWVSEVGETPAAEDWEVGRHHPHFERHRGEFPSRQTVSNHFGTWTAALITAGIEPRTMGRRSGSQDGEAKENKRVRRREALEARRARLCAELDEVDELLETPS